MGALEWYSCQLEGSRPFGDHYIYTQAATEQWELMFVIGTGVDPVWTHNAVVMTL